MQELRMRSLELRPGDIIPFWDFTYEVIDQPKLTTADGSKMLLAHVNALVVKPTVTSSDERDEGDCDLALTTFHAPLDHTFTVWRPEAVAES